MILQCDACGTRFSAPDKALFPGKQIRCGRCQHTWKYEPLAAANAGVSAPQSPAPAAAEATKPEPTPSTLEDAPAPRRYSPIRPKLIRPIPAPRWLVATNVIFTLSVFLLLLANFAPAALGFPSSTGVVLDSLKFSAVPGEAQRYVLTGFILNKSAKKKDAPELRLTLLNDEGHPIASWQRALPPGTQIAAGDRLSFSVDDLRPPEGVELHDPRIRADLGNVLELALRRLK